MVLKKILKEKTTQQSNKNNNELNTFTNEMIKKISFNLENFHYNVIIANFHEIYNFLAKFQNNINCDLDTFKKIM